MSRHSFSRRIRRRRRTGGRLERLKIEQVRGLQMTREHFMHVVDRYRNKVGRCSPGRRCPWDEKDWVFPPAGPPLRIHVPEDTFAADLERLDIALRAFYGPRAAASEKPVAGNDKGACAAQPSSRNRTGRPSSAPPDRPAAHVSC